MTRRIVPVVLALALAPAAVAAPDAPPDWPCIQPKVAELSIGQMWGGPPLGGVEANWRGDREVADLVPVLVARRTGMEEAAEAIARFAAAAGADKNRRLSMLFAGVFEDLNAERGRLIAGIERYSRKQRELSERIKETEDRLGRSRPAAAAAAAAPAEGRQLEETLRWDTRIYEERRQALTYVCESPVLIEQRAFALAREIQNHLD